MATAFICVTSSAMWEWYEYSAKMYLEVLHLLVLTEIKYRTNVRH